MLETVDGCPVCLQAFGGKKKTDRTVCPKCGLVWRKPSERAVWFNLPVVIALGGIAGALWYSWRHFTSATSIGGRFLLPRRIRFVGDSI